VAKRVAAGQPTRREDIAANIASETSYGAQLIEPSQSTLRHLAFMSIEQVDEPSLKVGRGKHHEHNFLIYSFVTQLTAFAETEAELFRHKAWRRNKASLIFFDETPFLSNAVPVYSLGLPGQPASASVDRERFGLRVDVIDSCAVDEIGPHKIVTPTMRRSLGVKGVAQAIMEEFFMQDLIPFVTQHEVPKTVFIVDKSSAHSYQAWHDIAEEMMPDLFGGLWTLPTNSAKLLSPLDNGFHSELKQHYSTLLQYTSRTEAEVVSAIDCAFNICDTRNLVYYYHRCGLYAAPVRSARM
jgi:hypothetical protein